VACRAPGEPSGFLAPAGDCVDLGAPCHTIFRLHLQFLPASGKIIPGLSDNRVIEGGLGVSGPLLASRGHPAKGAGEGVLLRITQCVANHLHTSFNNQGGGLGDVSIDTMERHVPST
jgi:hypothetical protein